MITDFHPRLTYVYWLGRGIYDAEDNTSRMCVDGEFTIAELEDILAWAKEKDKERAP